VTVRVVVKPVAMYAETVELVRYARDTEVQLFRNDQGGVNTLETRV
jgi:hypothetical protein